MPNGFHKRRRVAGAYELQTSAPNGHVNNRAHIVLSEIRMPFGAHKGERVVSVPRKYLEWLVANVRLNGELKIAVELVLEQGEGSETNTSSRDYAPPGYERWGSGFRRKV